MSKPARKVRIKPKHGNGTITPIQPGEALNPNGRPKNYINKVKEDLELNFEATTNKATVKALLSALTYLPKNELDKLAVDENMPVSIRLFIKSIIKDWKNAETSTIKDLLSLQYGRNSDDDDKPQGNIDLSILTQDQLLSTSEHLVAMLNIEYLEKFCNWLEDYVDKKKMQEIKIIEG